MEPDQTSGVIGDPLSGLPRQPALDFFAAGAVVMPPPEAETASGVATPHAYASAAPPSPAPPTWAPPQPAGYPAAAPWGGYATTRRRTRLAPAAAAVAVLLVLGVAALAFGVNKGGSALSNTQMLAIVHSASTGLTRSPATTFTMAMTISGDGQEQTINMSGVGSNDNREASFTITGPGVSESMIFLHGIAYLRVPAQAVSANDGKPWIGVRAAHLTAEQQQLESSGPAGLLQSLSNFGGTVKDEGSATVRGVQTTKYTVEMNLQTMIERESALSGSGTSPTPALDRLGLNQDFPMSIWIDGQGLPRELTMNFNFDNVSMNAVAYFNPISVLPKISAPPASQVKLLGSLSDFQSSIQRLGTTG